LSGLCANEELNMWEMKIAHWAVQMADATIKALKEGGE